MRPLQAARQEEIADCLGRCLDALPPESKALLVRYYAAGDPSGKRPRAGPSPTALASTSPRSVSACTG
jgi:hypothetical protein